MTLFLYRFVCCCTRLCHRRQLQTFVHAITSEQLFFISLTLGRIDRPHLQNTWLDFGRFLPWSWPSIFKVKYRISYISATNSSITYRIYRLNSRPQMGPSGLTLAVTLTLNFQGQIWNLLYLSQKWSNCHERKNVLNFVVLLSQLWWVRLKWIKTSELLALNKSFDETWNSLILAMTLTFSR